MAHLYSPFMTSFRTRPRFRKVLAMPPAEFEAHLKEDLTKHTGSCVGKFRPGHVRLIIQPAEQHYWSPQLSLSYEAHENGTLIRGLYGPNPSVWALFFYGYSALGITNLFASMWGFALYSMDKDPWPLWVALGTLVGIAILYMVAQTGQKLGAEQTFTLHHFFENSVKERTHIGT